jgi:hypothetical protein
MAGAESALTNRAGEGFMISKESRVVGTEQTERRGALLPRGLLTG